MVCRESTLILSATVLKCSLKYGTVARC